MFLAYKWKVGDIISVKTLAIAGSAIPGPPALSMYRFSLLHVTEGSWRSGDNGSCIANMSPAVGRLPPFLLLIFSSLLFSFCFSFVSPLSFYSSFLSPQSPVLLSVLSLASSHIPCWCGGPPQNHQMESSENIKLWSAKLDSHSLIGWLMYPQKSRL